MKLNDVDSEIEFETLGDGRIQLTARNIDDSYIGMVLTVGQAARLAGYLESATERA